MPPLLLLLCAADERKALVVVKLRMDRRVDRAEEDSDGRGRVAVAVPLLWAAAAARRRWRQRVQTNGVLVLTRADAALLPAPGRESIALVTLGLAKLD